MAAVVIAGQVRSGQARLVPYRKIVAARELKPRLHVFIVLWHRGVVKMYRMS